MAEEKSIIDFYKEKAEPYQVAVASLERLIEQGGRAVDPSDDGCVYFLEKTGYRCAVGVLLPDAKRYENCGGAVCGLQADIKDKGDEQLYDAVSHYRETLDVLQGLHDSCRLGPVKRHFFYLEEKQEEGLSKLISQWEDIFRAEQLKEATS